MLAEVTGLPENIFGFRATGEVDSDDITNVLAVGLKRTADRFDEIRCLLLLETSVENFTAGAWVEDIKACLQHYSTWKKIAVISDDKEVKWFSDVFTIANPGNSRGFAKNELNEAKAWLVLD